MLGTDNFFHETQYCFLGIWKKTNIYSQCIFSCNIFSPEELQEIQKAGIEDLRFFKVIEWLCNEIMALHGLDETVHAPNGHDNVEFFFLELSSVLSELGKCSF